MLRGVDVAGAFSGVTAQALKTQYNIRWTGAYIGGPTNGGSGWTTAKLNEIGQFLDFLPIYVGRNMPWSPSGSLNASQGKNDGLQACQIMTALGWPSGNGLPIVDDIEYDTAVGNPGGCLDYMVSWANTVHLGGYKPGFYAPPGLLESYIGVMQTPTFCWITRWLSTTLQDYDPTKYLAQSRPGAYAGYAMQYTGGTWLTGMPTDFDLSNATDDFPVAPAPNKIGQKGSPTVASSVSFPETGKRLGGGFFQFWTKGGGLKVFGFPITDEIQEDGHTVQYFERAKFKWIPGSDPANYDVVLERLGASTRALLDFLGTLGAADPTRTKIEALLQANK